MNQEQQAGRAMVQLLARRADLDIPADRVEQVAAILDAWQADAVALARRMSDSRFDALSPITTFTHAAHVEGEPS